MEDKSINETYKNIPWFQTNQLNITWTATEEVHCFHVYFIEFEMLDRKMISMRHA